MATLVRQPATDYFISNRQTESDATPSSSHIWSQNAYYHPSLHSSCSSDSIPISPHSPARPPSRPYTISLQETDTHFRPQHLYASATSEDWMRWEHPLDEGCSPGSVPHFTQLKLDYCSPNLPAFGAKASSQQALTARNMSSEAGDGPISFDNSIAQDHHFQPTSTSSVLDNDDYYVLPLCGINSQYDYKSSQYIPPGPAQRATPTKSSEQTTSEVLHSIDASSASSPDTCPFPNRKRKATADSFSPPSTPSALPQDHQPPKKTAHNMIEKRYRTNLNDKIAALRDSVPSLRIMSRRDSTGEVEELEEELQGLTPAQKLNKATVLSKATEYIAHLEKRTSSLSKENAGLRARVEALEVRARAQNGGGNVPGNKPVSRMRHTQQQCRYGLDKGL